MESSQPPPAQQPPPGWYENPEGSGQRYWDGTAWTDQQRDAPEQHPAPVPPHQQQPPPGWYPNPQAPGQRYWDGTRWTDHRQALPPQQPAQQKGRAFLKSCLLVTLGVLLAAGLLIGGCVAIIGTGVDKAQEEQDKLGITQAEFDSIEQGMTQNEVEQQLGPPEDSQEFEQNIPELQDHPFRSSCIYYPEKDQPLFEGQSFQFCFDEGKLTSKNAY